MIQNIIETVIVFLGIAVVPILFYRLPRIPKTKNNDDTCALSVIIPARNEEKTLPLLLADLHAQSFGPFEIICVDDDSSDATVEIGKSYGVKVIPLQEKPDGWTGKTWACQNGANASQNEILLFLDADVRLGQNGIRRLMHAYSRHGCPISVQPYHQTETWYEQCSMLGWYSYGSLPWPLFLSMCSYLLFPETGRG